MTPDEPTLAEALKTKASSDGSSFYVMRENAYDQLRGEVEQGRIAKIQLDALILYMRWLTSEDGSEEQGNLSAIDFIAAYENAFPDEDEPEWV